MLLVYKSTKEEEHSLNYIKQITRHFKHNKEGSIVKSNQMLTGDLREVIRSETYVLEYNYEMKLVYLTKNDLNRLRHTLKNYILLVNKINLDKINSWEKNKNKINLGKCKF